MLQWSFVTLSINNKGVKQQIYVHYKIDFVHAPTGYFESFGTNTHCWESWITLTMVRRRRLTDRQRWQVAGQLDTVQHQIDARFGVSHECDESSVPEVPSDGRSYWKTWQGMKKSHFCHWRSLCRKPGVIICVEVLRPSLPNGVMSSAVSLPSHTFTGQA